MADLFPNITPTPEPATERIGKYLVARKQAQPGERDTSTWAIEGNDAAVLGYVSFFQRWKQYTFNPEFDTTYNDGCLKDIAAFLAKVNAAQRGKG